MYGASLGGTPRIKGMDWGPQNGEFQEYCRNMMGIDLPGPSYSHYIPTMLLGFPVGSRSNTFSIGLLGYTLQPSCGHLQTVRALPLTPNFEGQVPKCRGTRPPILHPQRLLAPSTITFMYLDPISQVCTPQPSETTTTHAIERPYTQGLQSSSFLGSIV